MAIWNGWRRLNHKTRDVWATPKMHVDVGHCLEMFDVNSIECLAKREFSWELRCYSYDH